MESMSNKEGYIARVRVLAQLEFMPAILGLVREVSSTLGLELSSAKRLELIVEEACVNVIEHAFDPGETGFFDVMIQRRPGQVAVAVEDQGLPFDFRKFEDEEESGLGVVLMKAFADEVNFLSLGRRGKRVELVKNLPFKDIDAYISREEKENVLPPSPVTRDIPVTIRLMQPHESVNLARCVYRCYGYTYVSEHVYFPDRVKELIENDLMVSVVGVTPEDEIVGHAAMVVDRPDSRIGETGQAVVDPRFRGQGLLKKLGVMLSEHALEKGMHGTYTEAVAVHPFSQKAVISRGAKEAGIFLGFTPATMHFKKIQEKERQKRSTAVLFYTPLNEAGALDVYPPFHHHTMISRIYEGMGVKRNIISAKQLEAKREPSGLSRMDISVKTEASRAFLKVLEYGADFESLVKFRLKELCARRIDLVYLDLPLTDRITPWMCASTEVLGFFFAGIIPDTLDGDVLRLQYLNNVLIDHEGVQIASDFGKELYDYILSAREDR